MVQRIGGMRRKTRNKLAKHVRQRGKVSLRKVLQTFNTGDNVLLLAEPAIQTGMYFPRFHGKMGQIVGEQGDCYKVQITDGNNKKMLIVAPVHLRKHH